MVNQHQFLKVNLIGGVIFKDKGISVSDMLCIQVVREKMANQWDEDIVRNRNAKRLGTFSNGLSVLIGSLDFTWQ